MATEPKPKTARKKRRRAPPEEFVDYVVEIDGWDWGYSLSLNTMPREADPTTNSGTSRLPAGCCGRRG